MNKFLLAFALWLPLASISSASTLTWCAYYDWAPWIYPVEGGVEGGEESDYAGILIDQLKLFKQNNPDIEVNASIIANWKRCQLEVATGKVTMILGANKTPEREQVFDYLEIPAFINKREVHAYAAANNSALQNISSLADLRPFRLAIVRGDTFGGMIDQHINSLPANRVTATNSHAQSLRMVSSRRLDYLFLQAGLIRDIIDQHLTDGSELTKTQFKSILTIPRETPAYHVFGKNTDGYANYATPWLETLKEYHATVDIEAEIARHKRQNRLLNQAE
ncbi:hypothetical protein GCM10011297_20820 [Bacterioplanes sanyensis]|uniref:substrate-binding periplasmic protein n=1 Tax=Bacterioplanes sanyensis TaxID=1249553 RepID=UPI0016746109|nr:transporter substrate-binding domain-containing protein [Bacterioplanes sanyensis]GGY47814.1 hypothetical protein GCM10011297_20820 [Bacterioplanes sanyensis]